MKNLTLIANTISKEYRSKTVVNSVSLEVNQGEIVGLLGPNGAGKTTSFYIIVGLIQPNSGKIFLGSENITSLPMYKRARKGIGYLAQEASVFRNLSVEDNSAEVENLLIGSFVFGSKAYPSLSILFIKCSTIMICLL